METCEGTVPGICFALHRCVALLFKEQHTLCYRMASCCIVSHSSSHSLTHSFAKGCRPARARAAGRCIAPSCDSSGGSTRVRMRMEARSFSARITIIFIEYASSRHLPRLQTAATAITTTMRKALRGCVSPRSLCVLAAAGRCTREQSSAELGLSLSCSPDAMQHYHCRCS